MASKQVLNKLVTQQKKIMRNHPSVTTIAKNCTKVNFDFSTVNCNTMLKHVNSLKSGKATGYDYIPAELLKLVSAHIAPVLTDIFNSMITNSIFPANCKIAQIAPVFKKDSQLNKNNYRPVSLLTATSKVFEEALLAQLTTVQDTLLHDLVSAFRKGYNCQYVLLNLIETWKTALDKGLVVGAVATNLSKVFDCMSPLLLYKKKKLVPYGFSDSAASFLCNYLTNRQQCFQNWFH